MSWVPGCRCHLLPYGPSQVSAHTDAHKDPNNMRMSEKLMAHERAVCVGRDQELGSQEEEESELWM